MPHVVFVTLDTLSLRYVSPYGADPSLTPNLAELAAAGTLFERAYTQVPLTLPAHTTLFSGRHPESTAVLHNRSRVAPELRLLPEILADAGYRTGGFIALGVVNTDSGFAQGFETFADPFPPGAWPWYRNGEHVLADVEPWLGQDDGRPLFAWVHFSDPHGPYLPEVVEPDVELRLGDRVLGRFALRTTERYEVDLEVPPGRHELTWTALTPPQPGRRGRLRNVLSMTPLASPALELAASDVVDSDLLLDPTVGVVLTQPAGRNASVRLAFRGALLHQGTTQARANYASEVRATDRHLGELRRMVAAAAGERPVLWILASDHGEGLRHHGSMGHADEVYEDQLRIVWILAGHGVLAGRRVATPVVNDDVLPTVLELLDLPAPPNVSGVSRAGCLADGACVEREPWWGYGVPPRSSQPLPLAAYAWPYKLVDEGGELPRAYDLDRDPWETSSLDLGPLRADRRVVSLVRALPEKRSEWQERLRPSDEAAVDPAREEALRALGYLDD